MAQADARVLAGGTFGFELPLRMAKRAMHAPLELDVQGVSLTEFAQAICLQEQVEVSLIRLPITVQQVTFPLCLVAASCLRPQVRPRLGGIPAWPLRMIPDALVQCTVDLPSGLTVRPFADDPHITQEGFILHGSSAEIRAKVYRFLLQREISSNVAPSVREHLEWHPENGNLIQIFPFRSLAHPTLQAFPPPAKRRVAAHISPQPAFSHMLPEPPVFAMYQEEPTRLNGVYAAQAARPQAQEERRDQQEQAQSTVSHRLPFPSLVHEAWRRVTAVWRNTQDLLHIIQDNPLRGNSHAHQSGARACQDICTEMETLEDALEQLL